MTAMCTTCEQPQPEELTVSAPIPPLAGYAPLRVDMDNPDAVRDAKWFLVWSETGSCRRAAVTLGVHYSTVSRAVVRVRRALRRQIDRLP